MKMNVGSILTYNPALETKSSNMGIIKKTLLGAMGAVVIAVGGGAMLGSFNHASDVNAVEVQGAAATSKHIAHAPTGHAANPAPHIVTPDIGSPALDAQASAQASPEEQAHLIKKVAVQDILVQHPSDANKSVMHGVVHLDINIDEQAFSDKFNHDAASSGLNADQIDRYVHQHMDAVHATVANIEKSGVRVTAKADQVPMNALADMAIAAENSVFNNLERAVASGYKSGYTMNIAKKNYDNKLPASFAGNTVAELSGNVTVAMSGEPTAESYSPQTKQQITDLIAEAGRDIEKITHSFHM